MLGWKWGDSLNGISCQRDAMTCVLHNSQNSPLPGPVYLDIRLFANPLEKMSLKVLIYFFVIIFIFATLVLYTILPRNRQRLQNVQSLTWKFRSINQQSSPYKGRRTQSCDKLIHSISTSWLCPICALDTRYDVSKWAFME